MGYLHFNNLGCSYFTLLSSEVDHDFMPGDDVENAVAYLNGDETYPGNTRNDTTLLLDIV